MTTSYEFVVETLDFYPGALDDPDIIDCPAFESLEEAASYAASCEEPWRIALRRDRGNDAGGLIERHYAYPDDEGRLPDTMETATGRADGPGVPRRFMSLVIPVDHRQ